MGDEKDESFSEKVGNMVDDAQRDIRGAAESIGPALQKAGSNAGEAARDAADKAGDLAGAAFDAGAAQLTRFGKAVLSTWRFVERQASPPWKFYKALFWISVLLLVAVITSVAYQFKYGVLTLPIIEQAGGQFVTWMSSLGELGLFAFTAIGTLFFMVIPTEPFFFIILNGAGSPVLPIIAAALGSTIGSCVNFAVGNHLRRSAGKGTGDQRKLGKWGARAHSTWGTILLFVAAALPLPEIVALAYGLADYPFKKFLMVTIVARFVKWTWIAVAFYTFKGLFA